MLELFKSIFGARAEAGTAYPPALVEAAIERAVDGTDRRLRALSNYRKRLREPALVAIDHVVRLVDGLPAPAVADAEGYRTDPCLRAMFASAERLLELLGRDQNIDAVLRAGSAPASLTGLLVTDISEKRVLGLGIEDELLKRDV